MAGSYSEEDLHDKAADLFDKFEFALAKKFCLKALSLNPLNIQCLMLLGSCCLELHEIDEAKEAFKKVINENVPEKIDALLSLAELSESEESIAFYTTAVSLLESELKMQNDAQNMHEVCRKLASCLCGLAEVYLTDCCYHEQAEQLIEEFLNRALELDKQNPEVYQTFCSFRISQQQPDEALRWLNKGYSLWAQLPPDSPQMPSHAARMNAAKLFMELQKYECSIEVLDALIEESEEPIYWYLMALSLFYLSRFEESKECLEAAEAAYKKLQLEEPSILEDIRNLQAEMDGSTGMVLESS